MIFTFGLIGCSNLFNLTALDKSYMVTFSWEGQTKQIEVKSGNLIPVSEIPEIYAPDGKAVVWYNGNNAFSFSTGINEELILSSKVVDITAETICDVIKSCYGDMEQLVKLQGNCSSDLVIKMGAALKENPNAKIILDLGDVTGLTEIPNQALAANNALFGIILPKTGLTSNWALGALYNVKNIEIPASVTVIDTAAFQECISLESIVIPEGIAQISERTFNWCKSLETITIPVTVTSIGFESFNGCEALTTVNYAGTEELWSKISKGDNNECLINATINYGNIAEVPEIPVTEISVEASEAANTIYNLRGRNLVKVTGDFDSETVSAIGNALKENNNAQILLDLSGVDGLTSIPQEAFAYNNSLVEITLPDSVTEFGWGAFNQCRSLKIVHSLGSVSELQNNTFNRCENLQSLTIPATVTYMNAPFAGCSKLTDIVIEEGNANFIAENGVIYTTDRTSIVAYPSACGELTIDGSVSRIGASAFAGSRITSLIIPETVTEIEVNAFECCYSLETVEIRANISTIPDGCFGACDNLKSITIPSSVQRIGSKAFVCCHKLTDIRIDGNNFIVEDGAIYSANGSTLIAYPSASGNVKVSDTVTSIAKEAFEGCLAESITIPSSVTSIGILSFHRCHNLETVEILANVSVIPQTMFAWSQNLTSVTIPATVTSIEGWAFNGCENLRYVTYTGTQEMWDAIDIIEDGNSYLYNAELTCTGEYQEVPEIPVTEISVEASEAADKIRSLSGRNRVVVTGNCDYEIISQIGNALKENQFAQILLDLSGTEGLTWFLQNAFAYNNSLVEITLPDSVIDFGWGAFAQCPQLKTVHSLGSVSELKPHTFVLCENLQSVTIPSTVETIESWAFFGTALKQIVIPASVTDIWFSAFQGCYNLMDIQVSSENTSYSAEGGILYNYDKTVLHSWPSANGDVTIPSNVTTIGRAAFRSCNLESLVIPEGVKTIEREAIKNCKNIVSLEIPASVTLIEGDFYDCPNLQIIVADENENYSSENGVLYNKDKTELIAYPSASGNLYLPENITTIGERAFGYCPNLESVTIPASVTEIDYGAFNDCENLTEVVFEDPDGWYATDPNSGEQKQFELTNPSDNAALLVQNYEYYWTKQE